MTSIDLTELQVFFQYRDVYQVSDRCVFPPPEPRLPGPSVLHSVLSAPQTCLCLHPGNPLLLSLLVFLS